MGDHALREERIPGAPCRSVFQSRAAVRPLSLSPLRLLTRRRAPCRDTAYHYKLAHVRSLDPASQATQRSALDAIATALSNPTIFDFDPLFKLDAVLAAQKHPLFALLRIFLSGGLDDLHAWQHAHADTAGEFGTCPPLTYLNARFSFNEGRRAGRRAAGAQNPLARARRPRLPKYRAGPALRASSNCAAGARDPSRALGHRR